MEISFPFTEAPEWLEKLVFSRDGDVVLIEAVRRSGTLLGSIHIGAVQFNQCADLLLTTEQK